MRAARLAALAAALWAGAGAAAAADYYLSEVNAHHLFLLDADTVQREAGGGALRMTELFARPLPMGNEADAPLLARIDYVVRFDCEQRTLQKLRSSGYDRGGREIGRIAEPEAPLSVGPGESASLDFVCGADLPAGAERFPNLETARIYYYRWLAEHPAR